jgi:hypothetical protein
MIDRDTLIEYLEQHIEGQLPLEDLAAWADDVYRDADFEPQSAELIERTLAIVRDCVDAHRFRWEEPDFDQLIAELAKEPDDASTP